ncbi:hypothetical protein HKD37_18G050286 [Glycine soja]
MTKEEKEKTEKLNKIVTGQEMKEAGHLFFHCSRVIPIWWESLSWVNKFGAFPKDPRQHFLHHGDILNDGSRATRWKCWWVTVTWSIWQQRNKMIFSNETFDSNKLIDEAAFLLWTWLRHLEKDFSLHFNQWSSNLRKGIVY